MLPSFIHNFFFFLGTGQGEFFKISVQATLYTFIAYMVISEYLRSRDVDLRFLVLSFVLFMVQSFIAGIDLVLTLFGNIAVDRTVPFIQILIRSMETFALLFLATAFIYPILKARSLNINKFVGYGIALISLSIFAIEFFWLAKLRYQAVPFYSFSGSGVFVLDNILILLIPLIFWIFIPVPMDKMHVGFAYKRGTILAFSIYLIAPTIELVNHLFFGGASARLLVAAQPFPILSLLLVGRMVYLRLADKVSLRGRLEEAKQKYEAEKEVGKMKDEFVSVVSHELRTPLTSMKLYLGLFLEGSLGKISEKQKDALETIKKESDRLTMLIEDILTLSKLEAKKNKLSLKTVDLNTALDMKLYKTLAEKKNIKITYDVPDNFLVSIDTPKFQQLFINLFSNALKFTPEKGTVTIFAKKQNSAWQFSVSDNGIGIPEKDIDHLFDKFYQVGSYMTRKQGGTGLGLAIVKQITELHRGTITVTSKEGSGSTFTVSMPVEIN